MITSIQNKADLLITPRKGGEPDHAAAKGLAAARKQLDVSHDVPESDRRAVIERTALDQGRLAKAVAALNDALKSADARVNLQIDQESDQVVVKVLKESGEVIRQFPPKEVLEMAKYLSEEGALPADKGVLLEERV
jgi:flagellar protein FlaG